MKFVLASVGLSAFVVAAAGVLGLAVRVFVLAAGL